MGRRQEGATVIVCNLVFVSKRIETYLCRNIDKQVERPLLVTENVTSFACFTF